MKEKPLALSDYFPKLSEELPKRIVLKHLHLNKKEIMEMNMSSADDFVIEILTQ